MNVDLSFFITHAHLSVNEKMLLLLLQSGALSDSGLFKVELKQLSSLLGVAQPTAKKALLTLSKKDPSIVQYDENEMVVWMVGKPISEKSVLINGELAERALHFEFGEKGVKELLKKFKFFEQPVKKQVKKQASLEKIQTNEPVVKQLVLNEQPVNSKLATDIPDKSTFKSEMVYFNELFNRFFAAYPRKDDKAMALKAFNKLKKELRKDASLFEKIYSGALQYANECHIENRDKSHIKMAATWLNAQSWENYFIEQDEELMKQQAVVDEQLQETKKKMADIFNQLLALYPRKDDVNNAKRVFAGIFNEFLDNAQATQKLLNGARAYAQSCMGTEMRFIKKLDTFLAERGWEEVNKVNLNQTVNGSNTNSSAAARHGARFAKMIINNTQNDLNRVSALKNGMSLAR